MSTPFVPNAEFPADDVRHWLDAVELRLWNAWHCPDIECHVTTSVKLREFREPGARKPKKLTPEQDARETAASEMINDYGRALSAFTPAMIRIANLRQRVAVMEAKAADALATLEKLQADLPNILAEAAGLPK